MAQRESESRLTIPGYFESDRYFDAIGLLKTFTGEGLAPSRPETPREESALAGDVLSKCLRCGRKCVDYICEKCALVETET